jgi:hypothetical protein
VSKLAKLVRCSGCPTESAIRQPGDRFGLSIGQRVRVTDDDGGQVVGVLEIGESDDAYPWEVLRSDLDFLQDGKT